MLEMQIYDLMIEEFRKKKQSIIQVKEIEFLINDSIMNLESVDENYDFWKSTLIQEVRKMCYDFAEQIEKIERRDEVPPPNLRTPEVQGDPNCRSGTLQHHLNLMRMRANDACAIRVGRQEYNK